jgi:hypothetical protein
VAEGAFQAARDFAAEQSSFDGFNGNHALSMLCKAWTWLRS